jgi:hypothetical protein
MGFLAPAWLALAAVAAVPLLLHVLRQRAGARIDFPAVRWLASAEQEASRNLRLRQLLVLLLRVLAIVAIALAAARPVRRGAGPPRALAIVLDDSPSTGALVDGRPVIERLRAEARALRAASAGAERLWLVTADARVHTGEAAVDSVLAATRPAAAASDLAGAVRRAIGLARGAGDGAAVAILTDAQASAWRDTLDARGVRVALLAPAGRPAPNAAVAAVRTIPVRWNPRGTLEATLRFASDSLPWTATIGDAEVARGIALRPATESTTVLRIPVAAPDTGWLAARVRIAPDALAADDDAIAAVHVAPPAAVRGVAGPYVDAALAVLASQGRVRTNGAPAVRVGAPDAATALPALLTLPTDPGALAGANAALARLGVPWRFGAVEGGDAPVTARDDAFRGDSLVRVRRWAALVAASAAPSGDTLATVGRAPLVVAGEGWVLVGAALEPASITLPLRASFVPWLLESVDRAAGGGGTPRVVAPGGALRPPVAGATLVDARGAGVAADRAPATPGVYRWLAGGRVRGVVEVRRDPAESDLARTSLAAIGTTLGGDEAHVVTADASAWRDALARGASARPVVLPFLLLALVCLLLEGWLSRRPARGTATPMSSPVPA